MPVSDYFLQQGGRNNCESCGRTYYDSDGGCDYCRECDECGQIFEEEGMTDTPKGFFCESCHEEYFTPCSKCEKTFHINDLTEIDSGENLCDDCWEEVHG